MFCFDKAYSLKCLASDKQGFFRGSSLQLTWEHSLVSMNTHFLPSVLTSAPRWPIVPLLIVINLTHRENKPRCSGTTGCYVCEGICAFPMPKICQRLPTAFGMKSKSQQNGTSWLNPPSSHLPTHGSHPHPDRQAGLQGRFSKASCSRGCLPCTDSHSPPLPSASSPPSWPG